MNLNELENAGEEEPSAAAPHARPVSTGGAAAVVRHRRRADEEPSTARSPVADGDLGARNGVGAGATDPGAPRSRHGSVGDEAQALRPRPVRWSVADLPVLRDLPRPSPSALVGIAVLLLVAAGAIHLSGRGSALAPLGADGAQPLSSPSAAPSGMNGPHGSQTTSAGSAGAGDGTGDRDADGQGGRAARGAAPSPVASSSDHGDSAVSGTAQIVVHVTGAVMHPGVVTLPAGARVDDAVRAAGGAGPEADLSAVNLARPAVDGEQIHVPVPGEAPPADDGAGGAAPGAAPPQQTVDPAGRGVSPPGTESGLIDINTASAEELDALPGVGPAIAQRIVEHREQNGAFRSVDDLDEVSGIGPATLAKIREKATV